MRRALIPAFLLLLGSIVLGATVFREDIAHATGLAGAPVSITSPLDANGNVKVHEQGTANVNVTNGSLTVAPQAPVTNGGGDIDSACGGSVDVPAVPTATALSIHMSSGVASLEFMHGTGISAAFTGPSADGNAGITLALSRPVEFDRIVCDGSVTDLYSVSWVGNTP